MKHRLSPGRVLLLLKGACSIAVLVSASGLGLQSRKDNN